MPKVLRGQLFLSVGQEPLYGTGNYPTMCVPLEQCKRHKILTLRRYIKIFLYGITLASGIESLENNSMVNPISLSLLLLLSLCFGNYGYGQASPAPDSSRALKICKVNAVTASVEPTMDSARYGLERLLDGKLPKDGWRSTWTAWYQKDPAIVFDLGESKRIGAIRIYFQAWARDDELKSVEVLVSMDGSTFHPFNEYGEIVTLTEKGTWVEMDLGAVRARYFQLKPHFQGWGHQWGEVEFWELEN